MTSSFKIIKTSLIALIRDCIHAPWSSPSVAQSAFAKFRQS